MKNGPLLVKNGPLLALTFVMGLAACGSSDEATATAAQVATTASQSSTPTTTEPQPTTTIASTTTEATTTTNAPTTTMEPSTTTEPPVAGEAQVFGEPVESMNEAVGLPSPTIEGFDYLSADPVSWGADGPAAVLFAPLGDWCPHCSIHLDQLTGYLADNDGPQGAQLLLVTQEEQPSAQYPQDEWLASEGWPYPTVLDPSGIPISKAFGLTSVPTWILVGSDGTVAAVVDGHHVTPADVFSRIEDLE